MLLAVVNFLSRLFIINEQSFSIYMPYADITIFWVVLSGHLSAVSSVHWLCTALYNASPARLAIFTPPAKSVVDQMEFMSPAMSKVPWVDRDFVLVLDKTSLMPASCWAAPELSLITDWVSSPLDADNIAWTSADVLLITARFRSWKSCN